MFAMFFGAEYFNQPLARWDLSNATDMSNMFKGASVFNQDLGFWCAPLISSKPANFDLATHAWIKTGRQPTWGSCPTAP